MYNVANKKKNIIARIATKSGPCAFCGRKVDEEVKYGKLYEIGDIYCHYFCVLLSCCLIQKGQDEDGLFGFLYADILSEIARSKKHKCSYCGCDGANLGCSNIQCKKQFHLPCGRERKAISMFYGNYKSFCVKHAPKQKISDAVMEKIKVRTGNKRQINLKASNRTKECKKDDEDTVEELACVICYEAVDSGPNIDTFWPPCCGRDAWLHRSCLERMCLSAGVHYLKCPLCNDKEKFREAVLHQGYYIPDRDAAWELEQNAFSEIYNSSYSCGLETCLCPHGRSYDAESGPWDINLCVLCGSAGAHARCRATDSPQAEGTEPPSEAKPYVCPVCTPSADASPNLIQALHELALQEQAAGVSERVVRPLMPSRMSLRRTKCRPRLPTTSNDRNYIETKREISNTEISRMELNLKTPKRNVLESEVHNKVENQLLSPIKQLGLDESISTIGVDTLQLSSDDVLGRIREKLKVPQPLGVKRKIVMAILEDLMNTTYKDKLKTKEPLREWISPKKCVNIKQQNQTSKIKSIKEETHSDNTDSDKKVDNESLNEEYVSPMKTETKINEYINSPLKTETKNNEYGMSPMKTETKINEYVISPKLKTINIEDSSVEIFEDHNTVNIDMVIRENAVKKVTSPLKISFLKLSPNNKNESNKLNVNIDLESFKMQYLSETSQISNRKRKMCDRDNDLETCKTDSKRRKRNRKNKNKIKVQIKKENFELKDGGNGSKEKKERSKLSEKESIKIKLKFKNTKYELTNEERGLKKKLKKKTSKFIEKEKKKETSGEKSEDKINELKESPKILKQYLLNYSDEKNHTAAIVRPQDEVAVKRKYIKKGKVSDNFKQMSLDNFVLKFNSP